MSKIGAHVSSTPRFTIESFCRAKPAGMLGLNDSGVLLEAKNWSDGHAWTFYRTTRVYGERPSDLHDPPGTYGQMAHYWYFEANPSLKADYDLNPADVYIPDNEPGGGEGEDVERNYKNVVAYERELMKLMNDDGKKMGVLAAAGGSPGDFKIWVDICVPFIRESFVAGNWYVRHAYEGNWDRVYREAQYLLDNGLGYGPMAVTEWGFGGGYGQVHDAAKIKAEDEALMAFPNVVCFLLWEYGRTEFNANIDHVVPQLVPYMETHPTEKWSQQEEEEMSYQEELIAKSKEEQQARGVVINPTFAFIKWLRDNGYWAVHREIPHTTSDGVARALQAGEDPYGNKPRVVLSYPKPWEGMGKVEFIYEGGPFSAPVGTVEERASGMIWPGSWIDANPYGNRYLLNGRWQIHTGADLNLNVPIWNADKGMAVHAIANGVVTYAEKVTTGTWGRLVVIRHKTPQKTYHSRYGHMASMLVQEGQNVLRGDVVGTIGGAEFNLPDHLHFDISHSGVLETNPRHWPGDNLAAVQANYLPPKEFLESQGKVNAPEQPAQIDLKPYIIGDSRRYYLKSKNGNTQEILQCQVFGDTSYQVKNQAWESFVIDADWIRRDKDTSPGGGRFYTQREGTQPARWLPRLMAVGEEFTVSLRVQFYQLSNCSPSEPNSGDVTDTRKLVAHYNQWTSRHGVTLYDVIEVHWLNGGETYLYAKGYGLVEWSRGHSDPNSPEWTSISEIVQGGTNVRMSGCFS